MHGYYLTVKDAGIRNEKKVIYTRSEFYIKHMQLLQTKPKSPAFFPQAMGIKAYEAMCTHGDP